jgi:ABC-type Fe3+/spermidine/putrescine transport system ATPase subunit
MLEVRGLSVAVGRFLLDRVSLSVPTGGCHAIVGATGSGKSLLLEAIVGFRRPRAGAILLNGKEVTALPVEQRGISYVPQDLALFPHLSVRENILFGARVRGGTERGHLDHLERLVASVGIGGLLERSVANLSGGERQRVALVRALATGNRLLLLDEPFSALHEGLRRELLFVLKELHSSHGLTVLMVTHDTEEAFFLSDTMSVLLGGTVRQGGPVREIYERPADREVARYFGIRNLFPGTVTAVSEHDITVACPSLKTDLRLRLPVGLPAVPPAGSPCTVGIRAENVMIVRPDREHKSHDNILHGSVSRIFMRGTSHTVLFTPTGNGPTLEIDVPDFAFRKLAILEEAPLSIFFKAESLFLCPT